MKTGLAFSGGKDSWACLWLNEHRLQELFVIWVNTGKNIPEVLASVAKARSMCPLFIEVRSDRDAQNAEHGLPADVVPVDWTSEGQLVAGKKAITIQPYLHCCFQNISLPLRQMVDDLKLDALIMGQRDEDIHRGLRKNGDVINGVTYYHPIEDWSSQEVLRYLATKMEIPEHFRLRHSSVDCYDCTAYRRETQDKVNFIRLHHPRLYLEYVSRSTDLHDALRQAQEL